LAAAFEKALPRTFMVNFHAEEVDVKLSGAREIFNVEDHVINTGNFER
jgi:hypothetical protein